MAKLAAYTAAGAELVLLCAMLAAAVCVGATLTCEEVTELLTPCISCAIVGGTVTEACCEGIRAVDAGSNTIEEDRATCKCIMDGLSHILLINYDLVATLPEACGTTCPYKITPTTDCSKVE